jgi:heme oxygenase
MSANGINRPLSLSEPLLLPENRSSISDCSILLELQQRTAPHYRALEETAGIWAALSARYPHTNLLVHFFAIYSALETRLVLLEDLPHWLPDLSRRWKRATLESDLKLLGISNEDRFVCSIIPDIQTIASALGWLYVLEGSTLGGQIIAREVHTRLGFGPNSGCQFFSSYGSEVGAMWTAFGGHLESFYRTNLGCREEIIQGAVTAFEYFSHWLSFRRDTPTANQTAGICKT